jgi:energy-coupling factor transporter ATP-binding protein EcfA2
MARAERITEILATDDRLEERPDAYNGLAARGAIELDSVSFAYEPDRPALVNVSLRIEAGTRLALVGRSGAGKSTVAALIARFYDPPPDGRRVVLDGRPQRRSEGEWLGDQVGQEDHVGDDAGHQVPIEEDRLDRPGYDPGAGGNRDEQKSQDQQGTFVGRNPHESM